MSFLSKRATRSVLRAGRATLKAIFSAFRGKSPEARELRECLREQRDLRWKMPERDAMQRIFFRKMATTIAVALLFLIPLCVIFARRHHADDAGLIFVVLATAGYVMSSHIAINRNLNEQFWTIISRVPAEAQPTVFRPEFFQRYGGKRRACDIMDDLKRKEGSLREAMEIRSAMTPTPSPSATQGAASHATPDSERLERAASSMASRQRPSPAPRRTNRL